MSEHVCLRSINDACIVTNVFQLNSNFPPKVSIRDNREDIENDLTRTTYLDFSAVHKTHVTGRRLSSRTLCRLLTGSIARQSVALLLRIVASEA